MSCSKHINKVINKLYERALRIVLNDETSNFETLLAGSSDIYNHHRDIQILMTDCDGVVIG